MADERETVSDEQFFAEAMTPEPKGEAEQPKQETQDGQPRDDQGRFAPKAGEQQEEQPPAAQEQPQQRQEQPSIPSHRLKEEADARRAAEERAREQELRAARLEAQMEMLNRQQRPQQQQPEQIPDLLADPEGYAQFVQSRIERQVEARFIAASMERAAKQYGQDFQQAWLAVQQPGNERVKEQVRYATDPGETLMDWHRREATLREIGGDLNGYRKKLLGDEDFRKEAFSDQTFLSAILTNPEIRRQVIEAAQAEARGESRSNITNLPTLNRATTARRADAGDDLSDEDFLKSTVRLRR